MRAMVGRRQRPVQRPLAAVAVAARRLGKEGASRGSRVCKWPAEKLDLIPGVRCKPATDRQAATGITPAGWGHFGGLPLACRVGGGNRHRRTQATTPAGKACRKSGQQLKTRCPLRPLGTVPRLQAAEKRSTLRLPKPPTPQPQTMGCSAPLAAKHCTPSRQESPALAPVPSEHRARGTGQPHPSLAGSSCGNPPVCTKPPSTGIALPGPRSLPPPTEGPCYSLCRLLPHRRRRCMRTPKKVCSPQRGQWSPAVPR